MKFVGLFSGGKDSTFNIGYCLINNHELIALANLHPENEKTDEIDSYMFQTVGHSILSKYSECLGVPMYRTAIRGQSINTGLEYRKTADDETEDLYQLISKVRDHHPDLEAVSVGAILSSYQRTRVENVCQRLGLTCLSYLWQRDQKELLSEMIQSHIDARIVKVAAIGLDERDLGKGLNELQQKLLKLNSMYDVNPCGEGGEYETMVFNAPFFKKKLEITDASTISHSAGDVYYLHLNAVVTEKVDVEKETHTFLETLKPPNLLSEPFQEILETVQAVEPEEMLISQFDTFEFPHTPKFDINSSTLVTKDRVHINNLTSGKDSLSDQVCDIFQQMEAILKPLELTYESIIHVSLLISSMDQFSVINNIYKTFFTEPLPPSRVCVESGLPQGIKVSLSATALLNRDGKSGKQGLHVQSHSYWAPANIGPYSQARTDYLGLVSISGQIPLIPNQMKLADTADIPLQVVLSLQHMNRVRIALQTEEILYTIAYTVTADAVPLIAEAWANYSSVDERNRLIIALVKKLPMNAVVEWACMAYRPSQYMNYESDEEESHDSQQQATTDGSVHTSIPFIKGSITSSIRYYEKTIENHEEIKSSYEGHHINIVPYNVINSRRFPRGEVIPAAAVWDSCGQPCQYATIQIDIQS